MVAYTFEKALALGIGIDPSLARYQYGYGKDMVVGYVNCYVTYWWTGFYVAKKANWALYGIVGLIVLVGTIRNFAHKWIHRRLPRVLRPAQTWIVKHLYLSSTIGTQALEPVSYIGAKGRLRRWTSLHIPPRIHGILVGGYVFLNLLICVVPYRVTKPSFIYPSIGWNFEVYARNLSDRSAILSFGATPLVYVLASRNSPIIWLTGASYATLQIYHRWVGRMCFMHAFLHTLAWTAMEAAFSDEEFKSMFSSAYWNWGCVATAMGVVLCAFSVRRLRELSYEVFLIGHIIANVFWIVGCYYHVYLIDEFEFLPYLYAAVGFWAGERLIRLGSMLFINMWYFGRTKPPSSSDKKAFLAAEGYLVGTGDYIRLRLTPSHSWPKMLGQGGPGSHVFISSPGLKIYENHPFTIAWPAGMPTSPLSSEEMNSSDKDVPFSKAVDPFEDTNIVNEHTFELILKSYSGYTQRLARSLEDDLESKECGARPVKSLRLIIEGPYGQGTRLEGYQSIILIAGGSGISATTAHLADLAKRANKSCFNVERVHIVWAVRQTGAVNVLIPYLLRLQPLLPSSIALSISIHYTGDTCATLETPSGSPVDEEKTHLHPAALAEINKHFDKAFSPKLADVQVVHGRPDVGRIVDGFLPFIGGSMEDKEGGRLAVSACGPSGLCDRTREAVKARLGGGGRNGGQNRVESDQLVYHEEAFTW